MLDPDAEMLLGMLIVLGALGLFFLIGALIEDE